jgi:heme oxygenase
MNKAIMERLKEETKGAHQQLEKVTVPFIRNAKDNVSYAYVLRLFYGYFRPMEIRIQEFITAAHIHDIAERRQSEALIADLKTIGADQDETLVTKNLPTIKNVAQAIGAMYVIEGSTLGGQHISKMLAYQLNRAPEDGITFFSGYGTQTYAKWAMFTQMVNEYVANNPHLADEIVAAADETFSKFGEWVEVYKELN